VKWYKLIAYIALGSNLGDRLKNISFGLGALAELGQVAASPLVLETADESGIGPPYLNTAARLDAHISDPCLLLEECLRIEIACGRDRSLPPNSPRELDLDLITADGWQGKWEWAAPEDLLQLGPFLTLILPHPRAESRDFVMEPLKAIIVPALQNRNKLNLWIDTQGSIYSGVERANALDFAENGASRCKRGAEWEAEAKQT
jgi:2-amino-4-hydroxy-6-hydroxymethyldihydropteridine diphosphokinase